ncbi:NAD(P)/FAD-dependent oxidoreductase [Bowmanella yangjiangensis]|uniref:NAD(P)/FAD-dependent oxidoreductase n=1 Tax=Bowmanella yangjiangensis TaxID=2811230 RepID=A0ABS3CSL0_9ALTE|nr:NAD(P)/FAD-dependent oxidoreductase [Bowmanella yangjiangensis]MBN7820103.1 NAD(P)/FAD-dependent oxidoreductase [Bowmanella yangjiangensis]
MHTQVLIIGGSFAGLSAAMQLVRARKHVVVVDGGKPRNRFASHSHGFFGLDGETPGDIHQKALAKLLPYPDFTLHQGEVVSLVKDANGFTATLADNTSVHASKVILATGLHDQLPDIAGLASRWGKTVLHCPYCHGYENRDRPLGVLATSPLSIHQAKLIPDWGPTTYFSQGQFSPDPDARQMLEKRGVRIEETPVVELIGKAPQIRVVRLQDNRQLAIEALYVGPTTRMASPLAEQLGCEFEPGLMGPIVKIDDSQQTSISGVYAAGDLAIPMQNATLASASGVMAGVHVHHALIQMQLNA